MDEESPSQKHLAWDVDYVDDDHLSDQTELGDETSALIAEVQSNVVEWLDSYGRQHIRQWMNDNLQNILKQDGLSIGGGKRKSQAQSCAPFKKPRLSKNKENSKPIQIDFTQDE